MDDTERFDPETMSGEVIAAEHLARYLWASPLAEGRRVLDAGCGTGYGTALLADNEPGSLAAIDNSEEAIAAAREQLDDRAELALADIAHLPFADDAFDFVTCFEVIEHVEEQEHVIAELRRVLAPGGILAISTPNTEVSPEGNPYHTHEFTRDEFAALLAPHFPHLEWHAQRSWLASAIAEPGRVEFVSPHPPEPGTELYFVVLAADAPASPGPGVVVQSTANEDLGKIWKELSDNQESLTWNVEHERKRVAERDRINGELDQENQALRERVAELEQLAQRLDVDNRTLTASLSWRITAPVRAAGEAARKRRAKR